jgi:hypothetical protein
LMLSGSLDGTAYNCTLWLCICREKLVTQR